MDIEGGDNLPKLFISPIEKIMDEFNSSVKELRGLFKIPKTNIQTGSLHQQICNTTKRQFEEILNWIHRTNGKYRKLQFPKTIEGMTSVNMMKKVLTF